MVKNLRARQETWVQSLGWEDPLEKEMESHSHHIREDQLQVLNQIKFINRFQSSLSFPSDLVARTLPAMQEAQETQVKSLAWEDSLEKEMATHFSILA